MESRWKILIMAVALLASLIAVGAVAAAASDSGGTRGEVEQEADDPAEDAAEGPDIPITGPDLERASKAALDYLGACRVTATEVGDEESYYEVEVTFDNGRQIDVQLDEAFNVVGTD